MLTQLFSAVVRAMFVVIVVVTPSLLLAGTTSEEAQVTLLIAFALALFIGLEYAVAAPAILSFRDAPPLNRIRIMSLFLMLVCLCTVLRYEGYSTTGLVLNALGLLVGQALDFSVSPLGILLAQMPVETTPEAVAQVRIMAGLTAFIGACTACGFAALVRLGHWPNRDAAFNVWINLPTFDPTTGRDPVLRLRWDGAINLLLALFSPFFLAVLAGVAAQYLGWSIFVSPHALVWGLSLWVILPLSLFMRGLAMLRIAEMIRARRDSMIADLHVDAPKHLA